MNETFSTKLKVATFSKLIAIYYYALFAQPECKLRSRAFPSACDLEFHYRLKNFRVMFPKKY